VVERLEVDGVRLRLERHGEGEPALVYLHSIFGEVGALPFFDQLAASGLTVVAPELPGFGASDALPGPLRIEDVVFHLRRLLDVLGLEHPVLVGASLGGWLAAETAVWFPGRVRALVLMDAFGLRVEGAPAFDVFGSTHHELWAAAVADGDLLRHLGPVLGESNDGPDAVRLHLFRSMEASARIGWNPYFHDPKLGARLGALGAPALVVWGGADGVLPLAHGEAYAGSLPRARLEVVPGCGHVPALEQPAQAARLVAGFLAGEGPGG
jgi:pimeloyl-ACP methyl ester carboxylesterase